MECARQQTNKRLNLIKSSFYVHSIMKFDVSAKILKADPVSRFRGDDFSDIGQVSLRVHYCKRDEVNFTTLS